MRPDAYRSEAAFRARSSACPPAQRTTPRTEPDRPEAPEPRAQRSCCASWFPWWRRTRAASAQSDRLWQAAGTRASEILSAEFLWRVAHATRIPPLTLSCVDPSAKRPMPSRSSSSTFTRKLRQWTSERCAASADAMVDQRTVVVAATRASAHEQTKPRAFPAGGRRRSPLSPRRMNRARRPSAASAAPPDGMRARETR